MDKGRVQQYALIGAGLLCFVVAAVLLHTFKGQFGKESAKGTLLVMEETLDLSVPDAPRPDVADVSVDKPQVKDVWVVYVTGSVKNPGVYEVPVGARVYQALEAAGGFADQGDADAVNLAAPLTDGAHIRFPAMGEKKAEPQQSSFQNVPAAHEESRAKSGRKIDLNRCTAKDLEEVPGIGPKTALVIIQYREQNGAFRRIEDLLLVTGIGPKKYDTIKEFVVIAN
ncbi:helix-hairpin-helix domain-containing protein [Synergistaceae bacterium OttesenSCG-928-D05]|nr:helix-hairpin-helix domain-containing protein [Synergistaceae bacterium OttesenSCG-928-D05]